MSASDPQQSPMQRLLKALATALAEAVIDDIRRRLLEFIESNWGIVTPESNGGPKPKTLNAPSPPVADILADLELMAAHGQCMKALFDRILTRADTVGDVELIEALRQFIASPR